MTSTNAPRPNPDPRPDTGSHLGTGAAGRSWPSGRPVRPGLPRLVLVRMWANRPSLGTAAFLLGGPGLVNALVGWPIWAVAAVQWSVWAVLLVVVSTAEARRTPDTDPGTGPGGLARTSASANGEEAGS